MLEPHKYLLQRLDTQLADLQEVINETNGYPRAVLLLQRVDLLKLRIRTVKSLKHHYNTHKYAVCHKTTSKCCISLY